jgi:hypothetical protein
MANRAPGPPHRPLTLTVRRAGLWTLIEKSLASKKKKEQLSPEMGAAWLGGAGILKNPPNYHEPYVFGSMIFPAPSQWLWSIF